MFSKENLEKWGILRMVYAMYLLFFCKDEKEEE